MANTKQAKKRAKQAEKHRQHNASLRSMLRTHIKKVASCIAAGQADNASTALKEASSVMDRMAHKGIIHANKAARHKSRFSTQIKKLSAPAA